MAFVLNQENFFKRISLVHQHWLVRRYNPFPYARHLPPPRRLTAALGPFQKHKEDDWGGADSVMLVAGKGDEEATVYWVSVAAQLYLFDVELPESVIILTKDTMHFYGSNSKIKKLRVLRESSSDLKMEFIVKDKADYKSQLPKLVEILTAAGPKVGSVVKEEPAGEFAADWKAARAEASGLEDVDISSGILEAIASKDKTELRSAKVAAVMSCAIMRKFLLPKLEGIVDDEQKISHTKVAEDLEELFDDPSKLASAWKAAAQIERDRVDMSYPPIIQSGGGGYNLKPNAETTEVGPSTPPSYFYSLPSWSSFRF